MAAPKIGEYLFDNFSRQADGKAPETRKATVVWGDHLPEEWSDKWQRWFPVSWWFHPVCPCFDAGDECYCSPVMVFDDVIFG